MAEARLHFFLDTINNAEAQFREQKQYCVSSVNSLVKLLPFSRKFGLSALKCKTSGRKTRRRSRSISARTGRKRVEKQRRLDAVVDAGLDAGLVVGDGHHAESPKLLFQERVVAGTTCTTTETIPGPDIREAEADIPENHGLDVSDVCGGPDLYTVVEPPAEDAEMEEAAEQGVEELGVVDQHCIEEVDIAARHRIDEAEVESEQRVEEDEQLIEEPGAEVEEEELIEEPEAEAGQRIEEAEVEAEIEEAEQWTGAQHEVEAERRMEEAEVEAEQRIEEPEVEADQEIDDAEPVPAASDCNLYVVEEVPLEDEGESLHQQDSTAGLHVKEGTPRREEAEVAYREPEVQQIARRRTEANDGEGRADDVEVAEEPPETLGRPEPEASGRAGEQAAGLSPADPRAGGSFSYSSPHFSGVKPPVEPQNSVEPRVERTSWARLGSGRHSSSGRASTERHSSCAAASISRPPLSRFRPAFDLGRESSFAAPVSATDLRLRSLQLGGGDGRGSGFQLPVDARRHTHAVARFQQTPFGLEREGDFRLGRDSNFRHGRDSSFRPPTVPEHSDALPEARSSRPAVIDGRQSSFATAAEKVLQFGRQSSARSTLAQDEGETQLGLRSKVSLNFDVGAADPQAATGDDAMRLSDFPDQDEEMPGETSEAEADRTAGDAMEAEDVEPADRRQDFVAGSSDAPRQGSGDVPVPRFAGRTGGVSNLVASVSSFLPLVMQQQPVVQFANGKKDVKVKALEAAEAARRQEEKRIEERKRKLEMLKREKCQSKMEQEKAKKLEEEQKKKEEERRKREMMEVNVRKRKKDEMDRKEKRRKIDEVQRTRKEQEERMRAELEEKEQRRKAMEEAERERKAMEEDLKRRKRLEKEREAERRRKAEEDAKAQWLNNKEADRKRREETFQRMKMLEKEQRSHVDKEPEVVTAGLRLTNKGVRSMSGGERLVATPAARSRDGFAVKSCGASRKPLLPSIDLEDDEEDEEEPQSYELSPYKDSSDEASDVDEPPRPKKQIPRWASKENVNTLLLQQAHIDPDDIFLGARSCSLKEVFGTSGNKRRRNFSQRGNSGDWLADMVTWKEELQYKKCMGYLPGDLTYDHRPV